MGIINPHNSRWASHSAGHKNIKPKLKEISSKRLQSVLKCSILALTVLLVVVSNIQQLAKSLFEQHIATPRLASCKMHDPKRDGVERCDNCTSQSNQDLILRRIFDTIGTTNKVSVEFGFGYYNGSRVDELTLSDFSTMGMVMNLNTHALIREGWTPYFFDAELENSNINLIKSVLTRSSIVDAFQKAGIPQEVDYVSIDVDSIDVWLLHGLLSDGYYRPRVLSVEYNMQIPKEFTLVCEEEWAPWQYGNPVYGSSMSAINMVADLYGYRVVEIMPLLDMFFVRKDILDAICRPKSIPDFDFLAAGRSGILIHKKPCIHPERFVDFPLALKGSGEEAKEKAREDMRKINKIFLAKHGQLLCDM